MVNELRIYFEGDDRLKPGFDAFFREIKELAKATRCYLVATRGTPVRDFLVGISANPHAFNVLLLDSDAPIDGPLEELCRRKGIGPERSHAVFWMVQIMEAWFLADVDALRKHFGRRFQESASRGNPKVEKIPKADVMARLNKAAGGEYHKVKDGAKLLAKVDPVKVRAAAPNCNRMFMEILGALNEA